MRGAPPRPLQDGRPRHRWRAPLLLVAVMFAWMFVVFGLSGFAGLSTGSSSSQPPQTLARDVTVTPADGWESAQDVWDVGAGAISLQRAGALVAFAADSWDGTNQELLDDQLSEIRTQFGSFRTLPVGNTTVSDGVPALTVLFSGTSDSSRLEGELVVAAIGGTGVVMMAVGPSGQVTRLQGDLDWMLESLVIPR